MSRRSGFFTLTNASFAIFACSPNRKGRNPVNSPIRRTGEVMYNATSRVSDSCDLTQKGSLGAGIIASLPCPRRTAFRTGISLSFCLFALALPALAQWRTGYFMQREAAGQTATTIPWSKYTHVIHSALRPTYTNGTCGLDSTEGLLSAADIKDFVNRARAAGVKPIIGIRQDDILMAITTCTAPQNIAEFVDQIRSFVTNTDYDGVDLDWETNIIPPQYQDLIRRLRTALPTAILSVVVGFNDRFMTAAVQYDLDQINIRAYDLASQDLTGSAINYTWYHSPTLQGANTQDQAMDILSWYYVYAGNASSKLGLAVPFYGRIRKGCLDVSGAAGVTDPNQAWLGRAEIGSIPYRELVNSPYWSAGTRVWDDSRKSQYIQYRDGSCTTDAFIPYLGPEQLQAAVALIKTNRLGGIAAYGLPYEYMAQQSGDARYPLSTALYDAMVNSSTEPVSIKPSHTATAQAATLSSTKTRISSIGYQTTATSVGARPRAALTSTAATATAQTFSYYVDSVNGSDSNPGTLANPWKTIAKMTLAKLTPGQSVGFKCGGVWRETLNVGASGTAASPVTYGTYGTGAPPILTGANNITGFAADLTRAAVWNATVTTQPNVIVVGSAIPHAMATSKAAIAAPGDWYWAAGALSVFAASDPSGTVEAGNRGYGVIRTNDNSYVTIDGLTIRGGNGQGINVGSISVTGIVVRNCIVESNATEGFNVLGSATAHDLTIDHCTIQNNGWWGIAVGDQYIASSQISNNVITGNGWMSVGNNQEYSQIDGALGNFNIFGNTISATTPRGCKNGASLGDFCHGIYYSSGFGGDQTIPANIYQNAVYSNGYGDGIKAVGSANIYYNTVYGNAGAGVMVGQNSSINVAYVISYNVIYNNNTDNANSGIVEQSKGTGRITLSLYNNTVYQNANSSQQEIKITDDLTASLNVLNNVMYTTTTRRTISLAAQTGAVNIDYNLHWRADGAPVMTYAGSGKAFTEWRALGFDTHAPTPANPLFNNPPSDLTLRAGAPGIGAGVYIPGVSTARPPNIGAF
jgi:hypothetical protein